MTVFDYCSPAELFVGKRRSGPRRAAGVSSLRHGRGSDPITVEDFPAMRTLGACMQVGDSRYDCDEILHLYQSGDYPLSRRLLNSADC